MKMSYFPGCTLKNTAKELDIYARCSAEALGVTLEEVDGFQCCGGVFTSSKDEVVFRLDELETLPDEY